jgi:peptidyl-prolyl cis-trans isomerase D
VLVGDERVAVQDLARAYERQLQSIQRENPRFTREQADEFGLGEQMVQMLTAQAAVEAKARELGLAVSDQQVLDAIQEIDAFKNPFNNRFDADTYIRRAGEPTATARGRAGQQFEAELAEGIAAPRRCVSGDSGRRSSRRRYHRPPRAGRLKVNAGRSRRC